MSTEAEPKQGVVEQQSVARVSMTIGALVACSVLARTFDNVEWAYGFSLAAALVCCATLCLIACFGLHQPPLPPGEWARREVALEEERRKAEEQRVRAEEQRRVHEEDEQRRLRTAQERREAAQQEERERRRARLTERATEMVEDAMSGEEISKRRISRLTRDLRESGMAPVYVTDIPAGQLPEFARALAREGLLVLPSDPEADVRTVITGGLDG